MVDEWPTLDKKVRIFAAKFLGEELETKIEEPSFIGSHEESVNNKNVSDTHMT